MNSTLDLYPLRSPQPTPLIKLSPHSVLQITEVHRKPSPVHVFRRVVPSMLWESRPGRMRYVHAQIRGQHKFVHTTLHWVIASLLCPASLTRTPHRRGRHRYLTCTKERVPRSGFSARYSAMYRVRMFPREEPPPVRAAVCTLRVWIPPYEPTTRGQLQGKWYVDAPL